MTGDAYLVDLRKEFQGRAELMEEVEDEEYSNRYVEAVIAFPTFSDYVCGQVRHDSCSI